MQVIFAVAACASVLAVALICIFLFANGIPAMSKIGFGKFLTGELWRPKNDIYGIFQGVRTLTANIVIEMGYASGLHREALIATGVVLFVFILLLNFCVALLNRGKNHE